jgi:hypothetical protein
MVARKLGELVAGVAVLARDEVDALGLVLVEVVIPDYPRPLSALLAGERLRGGRRVVPAGCSHPVRSRRPGR